MVRLTRIYTRSGDSGQTSLTGGARVAKHDVRVAAYGAVDEANAAIGLARTVCSQETDVLLARVQNDLFDLGADLSTPEDPASKKTLWIVATQVERLEAEIDAINQNLPPLESFILPGGSPGAAFLHMARATIRRAERLACELAAAKEINPEALRYMNRLSDYLFVLARAENSRSGDKDVLWQPGSGR